jgi:Predicted SAM-dependent methyltransferases
VELPLNLRAVYSKSNRTVTEASLTDGNHFIIGDQGEEWALENDLKFKIDFEQGQKTGFFLDQRDNRALLGSFSQGKKVLNAFSYTGGFSLYALRAGAKLVHSVDISGRAIEVLEENVAANFNDAPHESFVSDVSAFLKESTEKYDLMIVDPPAFAKRLNKRHKAVIGYKNLNHRVFKAAQPNSLLLLLVVHKQLTKRYLQIP